MGGKKRFKITKKKFIEWMFSDSDDVKYWSKIFIQELRENGKVSTDAKEMLDRQDSLPGWLFESQMTKEEINNDMVNEDIDIHDIKLIK